MAEQHPITPPPELVKEWIAQVWHEGTPVQVAASDIHIATQAARWGWALALQEGRRPKPPSLKEQALESLRFLGGNSRDVDTIRRALEQLDD